MKDIKKNEGYEGNMKELLYPYMDPGTWKNSELVPLGGVGGSQNTSGGGGTREKRHET